MEGGEWVQTVCRRAWSRCRSIRGDRKNESNGSDNDGKALDVISVFKDGGAYLHQGRPPQAPALPYTLLVQASSPL